jgi:hypothetical protein
VAARLVPLEDLTVLPPDAGFSGDTKMAYANGWFRSTARLSTKAPNDGTVRFAGGDTLAVPLASAAEAYRAIDKGDRRCSSERGSSDGGVPPTVNTEGPESPPPVKSNVMPAHCTSLAVTGVKLGTVRLGTSRGQATVPAWLFTVDVLAGPLARAAVAPAAVSALPDPSPAPFQPGTPAIISAVGLTKVDGATLTYGVSVGVCDTDISALAYQADDVVVIGGQVGTRSGGPCLAIALTKPVTVTLDAPLGNRLVLDVGGGRPLLLGR